MHLEPSRTSVVERFCEDSLRLLAVDCVCQRASFWLSDWALSTHLRSINILTNQSSSFYTSFHFFNTRLLRFSQQSYRSFVL